MRKKTNNKRSSELKKVAFRFKVTDSTVTTNSTVLSWRGYCTAEKTQMATLLSLETLPVLPLSMYAFTSVFVYFSSVNVHIEMCFS